MDLATLIGLGCAVGIVAAAILLGGSSGMFFNVPSVLIVFGGTFGAVMMKFSLKQFLGAFSVATRAFISKLDRPADLIEQTVEMANEARKGGLLALEGKETGSEFLKKGRSGPRFLDSGLSEISTAVHAAALATTSKYTAFGVRRSSAA